MTEEMKAHCMICGDFGEVIYDGLNYVIRTCGHPAPVLIPEEKGEK